MTRRDEIPICRETRGEGAVTLPRGASLERAGPQERTHESLTQASG